MLALDLASSSSTKCETSLRMSSCVLSLLTGNNALVRSNPCSSAAMIESNLISTAFSRKSWLWLTRHRASKLGSPPSSRISLSARLTLRVISRSRSARILVSSASLDPVVSRAAARADQSKNQPWNVKTIRLRHADCRSLSRRTI